VLVLVLVFILVRAGPLHQPIEVASIRVSEIHRKIRTFRARREAAFTAERERWGT